MKTKSLDTPTIDLDQIILDFWLNATNSSTPQPYQTAKGQAKQALLQWHKSKARSYVPEKFQPEMDSEGDKYLTDTKDGHNACVDQTLKAIEESK